LELNRNLKGDATFAYTTFGTEGHTRKLYEMTIDMKKLRRKGG